MIVFIGGTFGRQLGLDEVIRVGPYDRFRVLTRRRPEPFLSLSGMGGPRKKVQARKSSFTRNQTSQHLDLGLASL